MIVLIDSNVALDLTWDDFEDSVQFAVGESLSADYIVTRNTQDFTSSHIPAVTPEQFLSNLTQGDCRCHRTTPFVKGSSYHSSLCDQ